MVSSDYTVSTAAQLMGRMPPVRISSSNSKSNAEQTTSTNHEKTAGQMSSLPQPTKPLPPAPARIVREVASRSSEVLPVTDRVKIRSGFSDPVVEEEVITLPATVYTPTTPTAKDKHVVTASIRDVSPKNHYVPLLETPVPKGAGKQPVLEGRLSQYFEYITPSASLLGRTGSRKERKESHTPSSSGGSDIYFSPIDATGNQAFLSSPQPSPPISPSDGSEATASTTVVEEKVGSLKLHDEPLHLPSVKVVDFADIQSRIEPRKITLTLADVDRLSTALALAPLVQMRVRKSHLDELPAEMTASASDRIADSSKASITDSGLPTPPPSEASSCDEVGGIALIETKVEGAPVSLTSSDAFLPGKCTHLTLPYGLTSTSRLRIEPASNSSSESKIILQSLFAVLNRKTGTHEQTLLAETDVTPSFTRAALTELAHDQNVTLDDVEIATPTASTTNSPDDESIDWCTVDQTIIPSPPTSPPSNTNNNNLPNNTNLLTPTLTKLSSSTFTAQTSTMQTLTLLSSFSRLQTAHKTFLILQPTRFNARGALTGVKVPQVSQALRERFARMDAAGSSSTISASSSSEGSVKSRRFRDAIVTAVAPGLGGGDGEFDTVVGLEDGRVRVGVRSVPLADGGGRVERWVCFLGGEGDFL